MGSSWPSTCYYKNTLSCLFGVWDYGDNTGKQLLSADRVSGALLISNSVLSLQLPSRVDTIRAPVLRMRKLRLREIA